MFLPEDKRNANVLAQAKEGIKAPLAVLEAQLGQSEYLLGDRFTVADLNVSSVISTSAAREVRYVALSEDLGLAAEMQRPPGGCGGTRDAGGAPAGVTRNINLSSRRGGSMTRPLRLY